MIIWVASYPRSGNTFFRVLLNHHYNIHTYSVYDDKPLIERRVDWEVVGHLPRPMSVVEMAHAQETFFVKTHELPADDFPAIYLVRDGRDSLISYAHYILTFEQKDKDQTVQQDDFRNTLYGLIAYNASFGGWGPNVLAWAERPSLTTILKFEDLVISASPLSIVKKALDEVGYINNLSALSDEPPSFGKLHDQMPKFFREGRIGTWRDELPDDLHELFWDKHGTAMEKMGYLK